MEIIKGSKQSLPVFNITVKCEDKDVMYSWLVAPVSRLSLAQSIDGTFVDKKSEAGLAIINAAVNGLIPYGDTKEDLTTILKAIGATPEDENQVVEELLFMASAGIPALQAKGYELVEK